MSGIGWRRGCGFEGVERSPECAECGLKRTGPARAEEAPLPGRRRRGAALRSLPTPRSRDFPLAAWPPASLGGPTKPLCAGRAGGRPAGLTPTRAAAGRGPANCAGGRSPRPVPRPRRVNGAGAGEQISTNRRRRERQQPMGEPETQTPRAYP